MFCHSFFSLYQYRVRIFRVFFNVFPGSYDGRLNAFLAAALLRVVRDVMPVQAPAVSSAAVRGFDTGVSGGLDADGVGRVGENAAACRVVVQRGCCALFCGYTCCLSGHEPWVV